MGIEVVEVKSKRERDRFILFPQKLYKSNSNYVGELNVSVRSMITEINPLLKHSKIELFIAVIDNEDVGRIAAIMNNVHLDIYKDNSGFFGFFDSINNLEVAEALFSAASNWLKNQGMSIIIGPTNLTTNDSCGMLLKGFEYPNMVSMPYNYEYYNELCAKCGFVKEVDLYSYWIDGKSIIKKYGNILERSLKSMDNRRIIIRPISSKNFINDIKRLRKVYNECNLNNWGFMPLNDKEFLRMAKDLKMIAPLKLALLVEKDKEIIGFVLAVPNINQALKHVNKGKLFPFGLLKLLWYKRKVNKARVMILGVLKEYGGQGIDLILYHKITEALGKNRIYEGEASFILESNKTMNSVLKKIGGKCIKEYRIYKKAII